MQVIDPHLHFFALNAGQYFWLNSANPPFWQDKKKIQHTFIEKDVIFPSSSTLHLSGFVHIEAGFDNLKPWREIEWLENNCSLPFRSIAFLDISLPTAEFEAKLTRLTQYKSMAGIRHILDDDIHEILNSPYASKNIALLEANNLIFEAQFNVNSATDSTRFITFFSRFPRLNIVLNHAGFPPQSQTETWIKNIRELTQLPRLHIKASGWEMMDRQYSANNISKHVQTLITCFSDDRVMLASNFPLCLFQMSYSERWNDYLSLPFSDETLEKLMHHNAKFFYQIP